MKTTIETITNIIEKGADCPLPISVIPNHMGINLCSVEAISWTKQDDGQLVNLQIHFIPEPINYVGDNKSFPDSMQKNS